MKILTKFVLGSLLGISLSLTGSTQAKAANDNCLLIVCVDAPILGPVVGTLGDVVEGILTPSNPAPPVPPVQPPVQPPVNPPAQPPAQPPSQPTTPQQPATPSTGGEPAAPSDSGNSDEVIGITDWEIILPTPTPQATPTPLQDSESPRLLPDDVKDEGNPFHHVGVLTPFIVGVVLMLLIVLSATSGVEAWRRRRKVGIHDTSALPHKK